MPLVQVRDFPEELYGELQRAASIEHRSVPQQVVALVERSLNGGDAAYDARSLRRSERELLFERIASDAPLAKKVDGLPSDAELVRKGREGR